MLILERPWTRQPQWAVKARSTGIGVGLVAYGTGAVNNDWASVNGKSRIITPYGQAESFSSASSQYLTKPCAISVPITLFALAATPNDANQGLVGVGATATNGRHLLYFATGNKVYMFSGSGGTYGQAQWVPYALNTYYSIVGRVPATNLREVFINGKLVATETTSVNPAPSNVATVGQTWVSGAPQAGLYLNGSVAIWGIWNRALSNYEIQQLYENPWQLFAPRRIPIPTPAAAAVPTLSASTYVPGSMTSTGWRPQITAS